MFYENETKNKILRISIDLFAEKGFSTVTIREIAKHVGIKGSSIYNHFSSKDDILDGILEYQQKLIQIEYDDKLAGIDRNLLKQNKSLEEILLVSLSTSIHTLDSSDLVKILKILSQNQLSNDKVREYFLQVYIQNARKELKELFELLNEEGVIDFEDVEFLTHEFHSFIIYKYYENYLLKNQYIMNEADQKKLEEEIRKHISFFSRALLSFKS